ncbi:sulfate permease [Penicillium chrysogenum]|nr:sulfate permease [Penicillium chrysogenum]
MGDIGRFLAKSLGIKHDLESEDSVKWTAQLIDPPFEAYIEEDPTVGQYVKAHLPTKSGTAGYLRSLFPFLSWIFHYNATWLISDAIAGITVGFVVVPQGMAYALLAKLSLNTACAVAVMSTLVGRVIIQVRDEHPEFAPEQVARGLALISGAFLLLVGLIRVGWIVEFIPLVSITSFMTGAAISIAAGQVPTMMGISDVNSRDPTFRVIINTLKGLPRTKIDAALGLSTLILLYLIRGGFRQAGAPNISPELLKAIAPHLPATIIVLIIEHIAISKSFGRVNNYMINPSQELVAIGFTNLFGPFLGGYPATGSFSRTAIKSKAGVRTPLAGLFTVIIILLALYALTSVFFYIPMSTLAALIIHAVIDLVTKPRVVYQFWRISPLEVYIFFAGVFLAIFTNIENGIYLTMAASAALLLWRTARAKGTFLGRVSLCHVSAANPDSKDGGSKKKGAWEAFLPVENNKQYNPEIEVESPHPGVFIFRFENGFTYANQQHYLDGLLRHVQKETRRTQLDRYEKLGDRPWNDPGPHRGRPTNLDDARPLLRAIILDCSSIDDVDVTSVQGLIDVRNVLNKHTYPEVIQWHFVDLNSSWARRAFAAAGFGYPSDEHNDNWEPVFSVAAIKIADDTPNLFSKGCKDEESGGDLDTITVVRPKEVAAREKLVAVQGVNRPFFHVSMAAAVDIAVANAANIVAKSSP